MTAVVFLSDIHLRSERHEGIVRTLEGIQARIEAEYDPAHVFVLGDLIEDESVRTDRRHLRAVRSVLEDGFDPCPVTYLLGNHDVGSLSRTQLREVLGQDRFYGRITVDGQPFVYLDSTRDDPGPSGAVGPEQLSWLRESVPSGSIVLLHHPVAPFSLADNVWFRDSPQKALLQDRAQLLEAIDGDAVGTVSGHIHRTERLGSGGFSHVSISAVSKERPTRPITGTYAVLSLDAPGELIVSHPDSTRLFSPVFGGRSAPGSTS